MFFEQKVSRTSSDEFVIWIQGNFFNNSSESSRKSLRKTIPNRYNITTYCQVESTENHQCITTGA